MKKALVIENKTSMSKGTVKLLVEEGYRIYNAGNKNEGISNAKKYLPDLIISDINMPDMDGYSIVGELWNPFQLFLGKNC